MDVVTICRRDECCVLLRSRADATRNGYRPMGLTEPAVLLPAISLLLLAYTNRFLALATLIRNLHDKYKSKPEQLIIAQIRQLRRRVWLIRNMQASGVSSLLLCVFCMLAIFLKQMLAAKITFGISLVLMAVSLGFSIREIWISVDALNLQLSDLEELEESDEYEPS